MTERPLGPGLHGYLLISHAETIRSLLPHLTVAGLEAVAEDLHPGGRWKYLLEPFDEHRRALLEEVNAAIVGRVVEMDELRARARSRRSNPPGAAG